MMHRTRTVGPGPANTGVGSPAARCRCCAKAPSSFPVVEKRTSTISAACHHYQPLESRCLLVHRKGNKGNDVKKPARSVLQRLVTISAADC